DGGWWPGSRAGLWGGPAALGVAVRPIRAAPPPAPALVATVAVAALRFPRAAGEGVGARLRAARASARVSPITGRLHTASARRSLRRAGRLDGVVQIGTGYRLTTDAPVATVEDLTIPQALRLGFPASRALPARAVAERSAHQRAVQAAARACCTSTAWAGESVVGECGVPREKVHPIGLGRNHDPAEAERDWTAPRFLFVGRD